MSRSSYWCLTLNNYNDSDLVYYRSLVEKSICTHVIFGKETGESGTRHLQIYLELPKRLRFTRVRDLFPRAHVESRRGTAQEARDYCAKDGQFEEYGTLSSPEQGKRTDLSTACELITNGATKRQVATEHPTTFVKYHKGLDAFRSAVSSIHNPCRFNGPFRWTVEPVGSVVLWGAAGIGKTEYAKYLLPKALFVSHMDKLGDFSEAYQGIIFDDMSFEHLPREAQIHIVDQDNPRDIHIRYTTANIPANTPKFFLTNVHNGAIFLHDPAIMRRIIIHHLK